MLHAAIAHDIANSINSLLAMIPEIPKINTAKSRTSRSIINLGDFLSPLIGIPSTIQVDNL